MVFTEYTWVYACGIILATVIAAGIGANSASTSFATSVGNKALGAGVAALASGLCGFAGVALMGANVMRTISSGIANSSSYANTPDVLMYGMLCVLLSVLIFVALVTYWDLPMSAIQCLVGAIIGMTLAAKGNDSVRWSSDLKTFPGVQGFVMVLLFWILAPMLSAAGAMLFYAFNRHAVMRSNRGYHISLWLFPVVSGAVLFSISVMSIQTLPRFSKKTNSYWTAVYSIWIVGVPILVLASFGVALIRALVARDLKRHGGVGDAPAAEALLSKDDSAKALDGVANDEAKDAAAEKLGEASERPAFAADDVTDSSVVKVEMVEAEGAPAVGSGGAELMPGVRGGDHGMVQGMRLATKNTRWLLPCATYDTHDALRALDPSEVDTSHPKNAADPAVEGVHRYFQVFTACLTSFALGSNEVAAAVGPLAAIFSVYNFAAINTKAAPPEWILLLGGAGAFVGLVIYGQRVMWRVSTRLVPLSSTRTFCADLAVGIVVIVCSRYGIPVSVSNCFLAAVAGLAVLQNNSFGYDYAVLAKVALSWGFTFALAMLTAAIFTAQGIYSPNRAASHLLASQAKLINTTNYDLYELLAAQAAATNNATQQQQAMEMLNATTAYSTLPVVNLTGPVTAMVQGIDYFVNSSATMWY